MTAPALRVVEGSRRTLALAAGAPQQHAAFPGGWPPLADGSLAFLNNQASSHGNEDGVLVSRVSTDFGKRWSTPQVVMVPGEWDVVTAVPAPAPGVERLPVLIPHDNEVFYSYSDDGGYTLSQQVTALGKCGLGVFAATGSKPWLLPNGRMVALVYGQDAIGGPWEVRLMEAADHGATWTPRAIVAKDPINFTRYEEPQRVFGLDHPADAWLVLIRSDTPFGKKTWATRSTSLGTGWTAPEFAHFAWAWPAGLYHGVVIAPVREVDPPYKSSFRTSPDQGGAWSDPARLDEAEAMNVYTWFAPLPEGRVLAVYGVEFSNDSAELRSVVLEPVPEITLRNTWAVRPFPES